MPASRLLADIRDGTRFVLKSTSTSIRALRTRNQGSGLRKTCPP
ncbi:WH2 domain-containing protein [Paraburkholderia sediminicola]